MKKKGYIPFRKIEEEWMKNPNFRREYKAAKPDFDMIEAIIKARIAKGLTQKQLAQEGWNHTISNLSP